MENFESTNQTFKAMRQLPSEVSFAQVKKWVNELSEINISKTSKSKWSFFKSIFPPISEN